MRYTKLQTLFDNKLPRLNLIDKTLEPLIQDWEVPWEHSRPLLKFALHELDLDGKPLMSGPIKTFTNATLYPIPPKKLYYNLGSYNFVKKNQANRPITTQSLWINFVLPIKV